MKSWSIIRLKRAAFLAHLRVSKVPSEEDMEFNLLAKNKNASTAQELRKRSM